jgi:Cell division control protein 14, SIN component
MFPSRIQRPNNWQTWPKIRHFGSFPDCKMDSNAMVRLYQIKALLTSSVATHLITCLERLLSMPCNSSNDMLLLSAMNLLQGMLVLHPPSRSLFSREIYMNASLELRRDYCLTRIATTGLVTVTTSTCHTMLDNGNTHYRSDRQSSQCQSV